MKTIKTIDLLIKFANGEKMPKKIMYNNIVWEYVNHERDYRSRRNAELFFNDEINNTWIMTHLNETVEILEEEKKIPEKLDGFRFKKETDDLTDEECEIENYLSDVNDKINEILDYLKSKGE